MKIRKLRDRSKVRLSKILTTLEPAAPAEVVNSIPFLKGFDVPQLSTLCKSTRDGAVRFTNLSGICVTMTGIILIEIKGRLKRGEITTWLRSNFPKARRSAYNYIAIAEAFLSQTSVAKLGPVQADFAGALYDPNALALDFNNPFVKAVSKWVKGRGSYELLNDVKLKLPERYPWGGNHHPQCPHCNGNLARKRQAKCPHCGEDTGETEVTDNEERATYANTAKAILNEAIDGGALARNLWRFMRDDEINGLVVLFRSFIKDMNKWTAIPPRAREEMDAKEILEIGFMK